MKELKLDEVIRFKKPHPCGGFEWRVKRLGVDLKLECTTCGRIIMIPRVLAYKKIKN